MVLVTVFALSAISKIRDFPSFRGHVMATVPGAGRISGPTAAAVIAAEIGSGALIPLSRDGRWALVPALILLTCFTLYLLWLLTAHRGAPCGCAGGAGEPTSVVHVVRNVLMMSVAVGLWFVANRPVEATLLDYAIFAIPGLLIGASLLNLDQAVSFFRSV
jgi:Na+-transporting NADH:ubiquinone oxidoreductase subunit NqrB